MSNKLDFNEVQPGHIFSEISIYTVDQVTPDKAIFVHHGSGQKVELSKDYITNLLVSADHSYEIREVGKEDKLWTEKQIEDAIKAGHIKAGEKKPGDLRIEGIKTIWSGIGSHVFTVTFQKKGTALSAKAFKALVEARSKKATEELERVKTSKKGVKEAAEAIILDLLENPVERFEAGEIRVLRGYKINQESEDGFYKVLDLDKTNDPMKGIRLVNINTIQELTYNGVTYIVK